MSIRTRVDAVLDRWEMHGGSYHNVFVSELVAVVSATPATEAKPVGNARNAPVGELGRFEMFEYPDGCSRPAWIPAPAQQDDARDALTPAARDVLAERRRQVEGEGWHMSENQALPPLPEPSYMGSKSNHILDGKRTGSYGYKAEHMRAYAQAAVTASDDARDALIKRMRAALVEADRLYTGYGLKAESPDCGPWINSVRVLTRAAMSKGGANA